MEPTHTPGPWSVDNTNLYLITSDRDGEAVCEIAEREIVSQSGTWETNTSIMDANAHLIAAAPAMYEALQIMVRAANVDEIDPLVMFASIERAKGALTQAEGRG